MSAALLFVPLILLVWVLVHRGIVRARFTPDERNPYRRYCRKCGQCQVVQCWAWDTHKLSSGWWITQGAVIDPTCNCHASAEADG